MLKTILLGLVLTASTAAAQTAADQTFSQRRSDLIRRIETYFNGIKTIKSRFYQTGGGASAQGDFYVLKPNKMRLTYDPPSPIEIVADGYYLIFHDKNLEQVTYLDLDDNPAALILKDNLSFAKEGLEIVDFKTETGLVSVTVAKKDQPSTGKITLTFKEKPFALKQWVVADARQIETTVTLDNMETNPPVDEKLFKFKDPRKNR